jgi:hypothetical protein
MLRRYTLIILCIFIAAGCSKKLPEVAKAIPADADLVASLDAKTTLAYAKQAITKAIPAEHKDKVPGVEMILKKAVEMIGIDLDKLGKVTYIGWLGSQDQMAFIAEGVDAKSLKGQKKGAHNGVDIYAAEMIRYAQLPGLGTLAAPSDTMLKKVLDAYAGKAKRIADSDRADVLEKLLEVEKDHDQLRVYVLTGKIPGEMPLATVVAEQDDAKEIKNKIDMGMMVVQMALAAGGQEMGLPVEIDQATQKSIIDMLKNIKTRQKGEIVTIGYKGDLKPLIDKAIALGIQEAMQEDAVLLPPGDDIAKVPPPPPPPPPPPMKK